MFQALWDSYPWIIFNAAVIAFLALDLGFFHRKGREDTHKEAFLWSIFWFLLALVFALGLFFSKGGNYSITFLTGYFIEKSLSIDNIFVFAMIFKSLKIPTRFQHRILFWGIISALIMRAFMIFIGAKLFATSHLVFYFFGGLLLITGIKMFFEKKAEEKENFKLKRFISKFLPVTDQIDDKGSFFIQSGGKWLATPLFIALVGVEISDIVFAVDSIPAIFAITTDTFIIYTANVFAILGLRSLYTVLAQGLETFRFLQKGVATILIFVSFKMLKLITVPAGVSLIIILAIMGLSVGISLFRKK